MQYTNLERNEMAHHILNILYDMRDNNEPLYYSAKDKAFSFIWAGHDEVEVSLEKSGELIGNHINEYLDKEPGIIYLYVCSENAIISFDDKIEFAEDGEDINNYYEAHKIWDRLRIGWD